MSQALVYLTLVATLGLATVGECLRAVDGSSRSALAGHSVLDQLRNEFRRSAPTLSAMQALAQEGMDSKALPAGVLALVWPQYLQTAAASRDPVTQVHARCCRSVAAA